MHSAWFCISTHASPVARTQAWRLVSPPGPRGRGGRGVCVPLALTGNFPCTQEEERWGEVSNDEDDTKEKTLPEDPETCLQLNMVYQEVIQEKLAEVGLLLAQNREQQVGRGPAPRTPGPGLPGAGLGWGLLPGCPGPRLHKQGHCHLATEGPLVSPQEGVMWDLAGSKGPKVKDGKSLPPNLYIGHFMKPYFKDRVTGVVSQRVLSAPWGLGGHKSHDLRGLLQDNTLQHPKSPGPSGQSQGPHSWMGQAGLCCVHKALGCVLWR